MRGPTHIIAVVTFLIALTASASGMRKVIYIDYQPVNWVDPSATTNAIVDMGYNVVNLAFWMYGSEADFVGVWSAAPAAQKQAAIDYAHSKGAIIMVACGGGTESPFDHSATDYGTKVGQFAANNMLDGVDFDLENFAQGLVAPGKTAQQTLDWIVAANNAARSAFAAIRGKQPVISHAPQGPYFGRVGDTTSWAGALGGYTAVEKATQVDFYNVQFYNQGATCYTNYEGLFVRSGSSCSVFPGTSISEINQAGVPMNKIILGKPLRADDAGNGHVSASSLKTMISYAQSNNINWNAGVMFWMFHGNDQASASNMLQTLFGSGGSSSSSSTTTTGKPATSTSTSTSTSGKPATSTSSSTSTSTSGKPATSTSTSTSTSSGGSVPSGSDCLTGTVKCNGAPESSASYQCCSAGAACFNNGSAGVCCGPSTVGCIYGTTTKKSTCCDSRYTACDANLGCVNK